MKQDERWQKRYDEVIGFIETNQVSGGQVSGMLYS